MSCCGRYSCPKVSDFVPHARQDQGSGSDEEDDEELFELEELHLSEKPVEPKIERKPVDETADKLDSLMELVVAYLGRRQMAGELPQVASPLYLERRRHLTHK